MQQKIMLEIPVPCHENWSNMVESTQNQPGRFCSSCQKNVVDFTNMTDAQVLAHFADYQGNTCGRFEGYQLNRVLATPLPPKKTWYKWLMAALVSGFIFSNKAKAQTSGKLGEVSICQTKPKLIGDTAKLPQITLGKVYMPQKTTSLLQGSVIDENGMPIIAASVMIKGSKIGTTTDSHGKFSIVYDKGRNSDILIVSYVGYNKIEQNIALIKTEQMNNNHQQAAEIKLRPIILSVNNAALMGDVVVGGYVLVKHPKKTNNLVDTLRKILPTVAITPTSNQLIIAPNPVKAGSTINIALAKAGDYQLQLINLQSNILLSEKTNTEMDNSKIRFDIPAGIAKGEYIINAVNTKDKLRLTGKLIVL